MINSLKGNNDKKLLPKFISLSDQLLLKSLIISVISLEELFISAKFLSTLFIFPDEFAIAITFWSAPKASRANRLFPATWVDLLFLIESIISLNALSVWPFCA